MFICKECGIVFEEPGKDTEYGEAWGSRYSETTECCPKCGGVFEEAEQCPVCREEYLTDYDEFICEECAKTVGTDLCLIEEFYEEKEEMDIFIDEMNEFGGEDFYTLLSRAIHDQPIAYELKDKLAKEWMQQTMNLYDYKKWIAEKAEKGEI